MAKGNGYKAIAFHLKGLVPLICHNGQTADPLNEFAKAMKTISGKRKKTDDDFLALAEVEFRAGLYLDEKGEPCIPGELIEAMLVNAAKKQRKGLQAKAGIIVDALFPLLYAGPRDPEAMWESGQFRDSRGVRVQRARVIRTRPKFKTWELKPVVHFTGLNPAEVIEMMETAGASEGLGDYRPRFGRFAVVAAEEVKA